MQQHLLLLMLQPMLLPLLLQRVGNKSLSLSLLLFPSLSPFSLPSLYLSSLPLTLSPPLLSLPSLALSIFIIQVYKPLTRVGSRIFRCTAEQDFFVQAFSWVRNLIGSLAGPSRSRRSNLRVI